MQRGEPRIFLEFPINYWIHSCSNFSQHHFQSTPEGAFFYTVYFCDFFFFLNLSKVFRTLKGRVKNQGRTIYMVKKSREDHLDGERGCIPYIRRSPTSWKSQLVFWNGCPGRISWLRVKYLKQVVLFPTVRHSEQNKDILSSELTFYTSPIIHSREKSLSQSSQV